MTFLLIEQGEVYTPRPVGQQSVLLSDDKLIQVGDVNKEALHSLNLPVETIDATDCFVVPGFIDPHSHLIGAGGEQGFSTRMPEVSFEQLVCAGITSVVGLLGTDTITREPTCLFAKVMQIREEGLSAYMYTGGFELPPRTIMQSAMDDIVRIDPIIGTGEIAISDPRWIDPELNALAYVVSQTALSGQMAKKAGVTHFHVGGNEGRLSLVRALLDNYDLRPECLYTTHITRSEALMREAIELADRGIFVDMDSVEQNIGECIKAYKKLHGNLAQLTVSSDAHTPGGSPQKFYQQFVACIREHNLKLDEILPCFTSNAARVLKLETKGKLEAGCDGDVLVLRKDTLEIVHVIVNGRLAVKDGQRIVKSKQEQQIEESQP